MVSGVQQHHPEPLPSLASGRPPDHWVGLVKRSIEGDDSMIQSTRRFLLPLVCVAALAGGMLAATAEPAFALATPTVVTTSSGLASVHGQSVTFTSTVTGTGVT